MITNSIKEPRELNAHRSSISTVAPRYSQLLMMVSLAMTIAQTLSIPVLIRDIVSSQDTGSCSMMKSKGGVLRSLCHRCH